MGLRWKWLAAFCLSLSLCVSAAADQIKFDRQKIELSQTIGKSKIKKIITVEVARSPEQHQQGLMFRKKLEADEGMLFVFAQARPLEFWMKNTLIDLDIAYFDEKRNAVNIQKMLAPSVMQKELTHYPSGQPALYALEMNAGWFKKNRFSVGVNFRFLPRP